MPKHTYPIVFIYNEEAGVYNGFIPDLCLYSEGATMEEVYSDSENQLRAYFKIIEKHGFDHNSPSTLEEIIAKWPGYKVSLLSANT